MPLKYPQIHETTSVLNDWMEKIILAKNTDMDWSPPIILNYNKCGMIKTIKKFAVRKCSVEIKIKFYAVKNKGKKKLKEKK